MTDEEIHKLSEKTVDEIRKEVYEKDGLNEEEVNKTFDKLTNKILNYIHDQFIENHIFFIGDNEPSGKDISLTRFCAEFYDDWGIAKTSYYINEYEVFDGCIEAEPELYSAGNVEDAWNFDIKDYFKQEISDKIDDSVDTEDIKKIMSGDYEPIYEILKMSSTLDYNCDDYKDHRCLEDN